MSIQKKLSYKQIWTIAYPIILGSIGQLILSVGDTIMISKLGSEAVAASGLSSVFFIFLYIIPFSFGSGVQIHIGKCNGAKQYHKIGSLFLSGLISLFTLSFSIIVLFFIFKGLVFKHVVEDYNVRALCLEFLNYRIYGLIPITLMIIIRAFFFGIINTKPIMWATIILSTSNLFLDYVLIFGKYGFKEYGIGGAAIASCMAETLTFIYLAIYGITTLNLKKYFIKPKVKWKLIYENYNTSFPISAQGVLAMSSYFFFFIFIEKLGTKVLAASTITRQLSLFLIMPGVGLAHASNTISSNLNGAKFFSEIPKSVIKLIKLAIAVMGLIALMCYPFLSFIAGLFTKDVVVMELTILYSKIVSIGAVLFIMSYIYLNAINGIGKTKQALVIEFIGFLIYIIFPYFVITYFKSGAFAWTTESVYGIIVLILSIYYLNKIIKKKNLETI